MGNAQDDDPTQTQLKKQAKELRFVTNYGAPHPKRRRIGAACLTCRKRKTACSGERPLCQTCSQNRLDCAGYSSEAPTTVHKRSRSSSDTVTDGYTSRKDRLLQRVVSQDNVHHERKASFAKEIPSLSNAPSIKQGKRSASKVQATVTREREPLFPGPRNRMPYFRWLGPTAIMPGFKQMVVKVKRSDTERARSSTDGGVLSPSGINANTSDQRLPGLYSTTPAAVESDIRTPLTLPFYDTSPVPPSELITHLANTFFTHLGCNFPFLQRERFLRDLEEKQVDAILVDAVCALAARFSTHTLIVQQPHDDSKPTPAEYGHVFAQRAKTALTDTFACPSIAAVQAAVLIGYNEFGESRDSGLWMYLGIAIRMAQDLGMHKLEGLKYQGREGPTPKMVKRESLSHGLLHAPNAVELQQTVEPANDSLSNVAPTHKEIDEQKAVEQERIDTFWVVFFLDRVVSSGTGRRSTIRDKDIELSFPSLDRKDPKCGWPAPFPALIRIVHLYGRVADLMNSVKEPSDITSETSTRLATMEDQVTHFYQGLSPRLHFDAVNFQHYVKAGEGTNFVLLHFWFHTLIILLHQPTLLKTFEGRMFQLFPNSQQLSMSSAKTIADILSYSQLIDAKASLGNPFTTQPIYIAACAFLKETVEQTATSNAQSRAASPSRKEVDAEEGASSEDTPQSVKKQVLSTANGKRTPSGGTDQKVLAKHTLLATAANAHYQLCYKALQSLETYWAGTKYILTVLEQKFEGVGDPLLYTVEEGACSMERPRPEPAFTSPGWRRKLSWGPYLGPPNPFRGQGPSQVPGSPSVDPSKAFGWTLTGTMNSPSTQLAWHYSADQDQHGQHLHAVTAQGTGQYPPQSLTTMHATPSVVHNTSSSRPDADLLLGLRTSFTASVGGGTDIPDGHSISMEQQTPLPGSYGHFNMPMDSFSGQFQPNVENFGDMFIQSQDVDMNMLGLDMMPWFTMTEPTDLDGMSL
ncbi:hypothetical protein BAUCODRAFT_281875 [Baudoinia panamericana UAMH 10762]|uniref:Zn(2)-C6 fungal-type domain-containing protein n=1 Tax=Baudoinia panamericana (strain UAMH 10762) TaxID=717646 RepID=M2M7B5_BAUPA|nr:uncharacterized protein BAUCODRAFT_281875 [Baudoinia panamericana UAMH 10762]EMC92206.1 hypothetical protein BAUCODRAFT_281875 [Baudoinia panamericana UAMH 10762]